MPPQVPLLVNPRHDPVLHFMLVFCPLFGAVFLGAMPVVIELTVGEHRNDEEEIGPGPEIREVAEYQGDGQG